jgi:hypothetical protein
MKLMTTTQLIGMIGRDYFNCCEEAFDFGGNIMCWRKAGKDYEVEEILNEDSGKMQYTLKINGKYVEYLEE